MIKEANEKGITTWVEPFVGGANMIDKVPSNFQRIGIDYNAHAIEALIAIRDLVDKLPTEVSEEYYKEIKEANLNQLKAGLDLSVVLELNLIMDLQEIKQDKTMQKLG